MPRKHSKPEPIVMSTICSICGLDWERHGDEPTKDDCIRLLLADLKTTRARNYEVRGNSPKWTVSESETMAKPLNPGLELKI